MHQNDSENEQSLVKLQYVEPKAQSQLSELTTEQLTRIKREAPYKYFKILANSMKICMRLSKDYHSMAQLYNSELKIFNEQKQRKDMLKVAGYLLRKNQQNSKDQQKSSERQKNSQHHQSHNQQSKRHDKKQKGPWISPFFYYLNENKHKIAEKYSLNDKVEVYKKAVKKWRKMTPNHQASYQNKAIQKGKIYVEQALLTKMKEKKKRMRIVCQNMNPITFYVSEPQKQTIQQGDK